MPFLTARTSPLMVDSLPLTAIIPHGHVSIIRDHRKWNSNPTYSQSACSSLRFKTPPASTTLLKLSNTSSTPARENSALTLTWERPPTLRAWRMASMLPFKWYTAVVMETCTRYEHYFCFYYEGSECWRLSSQCADVILRKNFTIPSNVSCANVTASSSSSAPSSTSPSSSPNGAVSWALNGNEKMVVGLTSFMVVVGALLTAF